MREGGGGGVGVRTRSVNSDMHIYVGKLFGLTITEFDFDSNHSIILSIHHLI